MEVKWVEKIEEHMKSISSIAGNRYLKKEFSNAYNCSVPLIQAYRTFKDKLLTNNKQKKIISFSSFYKYMPKKFKHPHRLSDLCNFCEKNKVIFKKTYRK